MVTVFLPSLKLIEKEPGFTFEESSRSCIQTVAQLKVDAKNEYNNKNETNNFRKKGTGTMILPESKFYKNNFN